jgi:hypothetical protein
MKKLLVGAALVTVASLSAQELPPPFPRPNATKLLETDKVVVWNIVWPKGQPTPMHRHVYDQVGTYYARGGRKITNTDGSARDAMTEVGSISTTRKGTTHIEEGTTDPPLRAVFLELKLDDPGNTFAGGVAVPPRPGAKNVHEETRVRVWDVTPASGAAPVDYTTVNDTVLVWLSEGTVRQLNDQGVAEEVRVAPGTMRYIRKGARQTETVLAGTPRAIIFELR